MKKETLPPKVVCGLGPVRGVACLACCFRGRRVEAVKRVVQNEEPRPRAERAEDSQNWLSSCSFIPGLDYCAMAPPAAGKGRGDGVD